MQAVGCIDDTTIAEGNKPGCDAQNWFIYAGKDALIVVSLAITDY